jgi:hypothetical protein
MSLSPARRKSLQRQRDRVAGWSEITLKVAADRVEEVRAFAAALPPPQPPRDPRQLDLLQRIEEELAGSVQPADQRGFFE